VQLAEELNTATTLLPSTKAALVLQGGKGDAELAATAGATKNRSKKAAGAAADN